MDELDMVYMTEEKIANENPATPLKAIKNYCIMCMGYQKSFVKDCPSTKCPLHAYRMGKNSTKAKREYSDEERKVFAERMKRARNNKT